MSQSKTEYTTCTFIYKNCKNCHEEIYIEDMINGACITCHRDPHKHDKFKCRICKYSCNTSREIKMHYNDTLHKKNLNLIKQWLFN